MKLHYQLIAVSALIFSVLLSSNASAQTPQLMSYQGVVRDAGNLLVTDVNVGMKISIVQDTPDGTTVFSETHTPMTNSNGLATIMVGGGTTVTGDFSTIDWGDGPYFLKSEVDPTGGTAYTITGTSQLLSVPYALHSGGDNDWTITDGNLYNEDQPVGIGTDTPNAMLEVSGDAIIHGVTVGTGTGDMASNTVLGESALSSNTTGFDNTAVGAGTLQYSTEQTGLTAIGNQALHNIGNNGYPWEGSFNTAVGDHALASNVQGGGNVAIGHYALEHNLAGDNTAVGGNALRFNTTGASNTAVGKNALHDQTEGFANVAVGHLALQNSTTASNNTAVGSQALNNNVTGSQNTAIGKNALFSSVGGHNNSAVGFEALFSNTFGLENVALGFRALKLNTTGSTNTAVGYNALHDNIDGDNNTAYGNSSMEKNIEGNGNTAVGVHTLEKNTIGQSNNAFGFNSLANNISGYSNSAFGAASLYGNTSGYNNAAFGNGALSSNSTGYENVAIGYDALENNGFGYANVATGPYALSSNGSGYGNAATGFHALSSNTIGVYNVAVGFNCLRNSTNGNLNTGIGDSSLFSNEIGHRNTAVGHGANFSGTAYSNSTGIGADADCTASDQVRLGDSSVSSIGGYSSWTTLPSDERFKDQVREDVSGLEFITRLRPVTYEVRLTEIDAFFTEHYGVNGRVVRANNNTKSNARMTGFIAQEVESAAREVGYEFSGVDAPKNPDDFYGIRYAEFVVPLVKAVQEQQDIIDELKERIEALESQLTE